MLETSYFLLFPQFFLPIPKRISVFKLHLFCCLQVLSICTSLKICCFVKNLIITKWRIFDWLGIESIIYADDKKSDSKSEVCYGMSRNHYGKRRKCWLQAFYAFPASFQKASFLASQKVWVVFLQVKRNWPLPYYLLNSLPNNKILDWTKFKVFADDK